MGALGRFKGWAAMAAAVSMLAAGAFAQGANTAYVPFVVNADATITAVQDADTVKLSVAENVEGVLVLPRGVTSVWNTGGTQGRLNAPIITNSRGNITLRLPPQSYQNAEIALHSVNGKRVLRAKAAASEAGNAISRRNIAAGAYLLSVKGANGNAVTTRLTHGGGNLNISVAFGAESVSHKQRLEKKTTAEDGDWEITVSADGYITQTHTLRPVVGINNRQVINLDVAPQAQFYTLTIAATDGGTVSPSVGAHTYDTGALVTVTATANSGYTFKNWSGASTSTSATVNITIDGNKTLTANFQQNDTPRPATYTLTIAATNGGTVSPSVGAHTYDAEALVAVTATASNGYTFKNWSGASTSTSATVNITMDENKTLIANFQQNDTPQPGNTFVDSRDGKTYKKVTIGTQTWMGENLNYNASGSVCYGNSADSCAKYGRLYNWATAMNGASSSSLSPSGVQGACPVGWHIPSNYEWSTLVNYVGDWETAETKLKSTSGWWYNNGTDNYGWSALPGGVYSDGSFYNAGIIGYWWSATEYNDGYAWGRISSNIYGHAFISDGDGKAGLWSVRCVQNAGTPQPPTTYTLRISATAGGMVSPSVGVHTYDAGALVTVTATANSGYTFKNWSGEFSSTSTTVNITMDWNKTLTANFQRNGGTPTPTITTFVDSRDGKTYKKVTIGAQTWMAENLNYDAESSVCYGNSADSCAKYGRLYNWATAMNGASSSSLSPSGVQGACPVGWHIPSDAEWTTLTDFVGSNAGTKLKSSTGWNSYSGVPAGTDNYGWSALPGGDGVSGVSFGSAGNYGGWWSATELDFNSARNRGMSYYYEDVGLGNYGKSHLYSVRCVQD